MATYKVVDADQLNADMTSVADSIRTKRGTTEALAWPDGYKTAIEAIQTGGGGGGGMYFEKTTFSADTKTYTLNHNLGKKPNFCFFSILTNKEKLGINQAVAGTYVVLDGAMRYVHIGTANTIYKEKAFAYVATSTVGGVSELVAVSGKAIVVPTAVTESMLTLKGNGYTMPSGDYLFCCGQFALGGGS